MEVNNSSLIGSLRNVRGANDILSRLQSNSLEARRERLAAALQSEEFKDGPADLVATYPKHVLALKEGVLMRIALEENDEVIRFGLIEIYDVPVPATDIGAEIIETAKAAVESILSENMDTAGPMISSIARALDIRGNLQHQIESDVRLRLLTRDAWWQDVVSESFEGEVNLPEARESNPENIKTALAGSIDDLLSIIKTETAEAARAIKKLAERKNVLPIYVECANDIYEDIKSAVSALSEVNRESIEDMQKTYSTVGHVAPRLVKGSKFLTQLANNS